MPAWEPGVPNEVEVQSKFKLYADWMTAEQQQPRLVSQHSFGNFNKKFESSDPDFFLQADQSATTCSLASPVPCEETKCTQVATTDRKQPATITKHVPMIRNPGKIAKPPRKAVPKKEVEASVIARKTSRCPQRKEKSSGLTDFTQKQERSDAPNK